MLFLLSLILYFITYLANYSAKKVWYRFSLINGCAAGILFGLGLEPYPYELRSLLTSIGLGLVFSIIAIRAGIYVRRLKEEADKKLGW